MDSSSTSEAGEGPDKIDEPNFGGFSYGIGMSLGVLGVVMIIAYLSHICNRIRAASRQNNNRSSNRSSIATSTTVEDDMMTISQQGLDEDTLRTYPKLVYSQAKPQKDDSSASGCSICLADYKDTDMLRLLPDCGHIFHLKCIDPWLRLHPTCPICRMSPMPSPISEVASLATR